MQFTGNQRDDISKILNTGLGMAAMALMDITSEEVSIKVSLIDLVSVDMLNQSFDAYHGSLMAINQTIRGSYGGNALLLLTEESSLQLTRALLDDTVLSKDMTDIEKEVISEVGNIVLNASLASLFDLLQSSDQRGGLPRFICGSINTILAGLDSTVIDNEQMALFMRMEFNINQHRTRGFVAILLSCLAMEIVIDNLGNQNSTIS